jgi:solute carrier family 25 (mitochondrial carnitine/acylcarnitine transporter), member 20/29
MAGEATTTTDTWTRVRKFIAGYISGACLVLAGHPFDTIKVRMQSEGSASKRFNGVIDCVTKTVKHEGMRGLYKGMGAPLAMTGGINSILFGTQFNIVSEFVKQRGGVPGEDKPTLQETMKAAVISGAFISIFVTPMEGVKARLQVQYNDGTISSSSNSSKKLNYSYNGPIDCAKKVYRNVGIVKGIYRGWLTVTLSRMCNFSYFGGYFYISNALVKMVNRDDNGNEPLPPWAAVCAGGSAGCCYWLTCYPIDVVKNKLMAQSDARPIYKSTTDCVKQIWKQEGYRGFFVGFTPCLIRSFPANAAAFLGFEIAMRFLPK